jgi:hypothetical protein
MSDTARWEYTSASLAQNGTTHQLLVSLNAHGLEGWELVTVVATEPRFGTIQTAILKRPLDKTGEPG